MSNADIMVEVIRLAEQIGNVEDAHLYPNDYISVDGKTRDGKVFYINVSLREGEKNGN